MPLYDVLVDRRDLFPSPFTGKKALVPGAGRGHDVLLLASFGFDVYGLDISPEASAAAKENEENNGGVGIYEAKEGQRGSVFWLTGDFLSWDFSGIGKFDLIFDYTVRPTNVSTNLPLAIKSANIIYKKFLCALPPELRPKWSRAMARNLAPNGRLVCLEFPTTKPTDSGGPPFALPRAVYDALLGRPGQEIPYDKKEAVDLERLSPETHDALERLAHIIPRRSHTDGYDENGNMVDRLSVWIHRSSQTKA